MKLLITTQAVDLDDPVLGFFHRWIVEIAKRCDSVHVICLKEGRHQLPANVTVHSLGKEGGRSRAKYVTRFYRYIWRYRKEYDSVFVHMNSEYVCLGGLLWRSWGKRVVLWRNHKGPGFTTSIAARLANTICYTSSSAFVAKFKNAVKMPIGIDTEFFSPAAAPAQPRSILFLGRLDAVKKVAEFINALEKLHEQGVGFFADIVGDPTDPGSKYAHDVRNLASPLALDGVLAMRQGVTQDVARDLFRSHEIYVNLTPSGSFDKTIGEAMAAGCVCVVANDALKGILPDRFVSKDGSGIAAALEMPEAERRELVTRSRAYVEKEHSLALLTEKLVGLLS